ncbi:hypothetical protein [Streptomyces ehimensis]|uniref:Uncharacterized protein n=1 Tax=Streptomyces ehimensis TaxID=68195 RepID=A0ABV9BC77_9ACTN
MAELTRFQVTRRAERRPLASSDQVLVYGKRAEPTELLGQIDEAVHGEGGLSAVRALARQFTEGASFVDPDKTEVAPGVETEVRRLDQWLTRHPNACAEEVAAALLAAAMRLGFEEVTLETAATVITCSEKWSEFRARLGDSLVAALLAGNGGPAVTAPGKWDDGKVPVFKASRLTRWVLVCGVVETLTECERGFLSVRELLNRVPVLPCPLFPLPFRSRLARMPAFSDLYVVRDEWARYVPGEIAHIENVLKGESKERVHKRIDESETVETRTEAEITITEKDTQSTDRSLLKMESGTDTNLTVGVEGQVNTSGQYGPTHVETHIGGSVEYSRAESERRASEQAHELVERAIARTELRVSETRTRRTLQRVEERNRHLVDNSKTPDGHVTGVYRWVDKIQRMQIFRYPHRYLLEFQVPEPATFVRWLIDHKPEPKGVLSEPAPFTVTGKADGLRLTVANMTVADYGTYATRYNVTGLPEPPTPEIAVSESFVVSGGERKESIDNYGSIPFPPTGAQAKEIAIPEGYAAVSAVGSVAAAPELANWKDWTDWDNSSAGEDGVHEHVGWHEIVAMLEIGGRTARASTQDSSTKPANTVTKTAGVYHSFWLAKEFRWNEAGVQHRQVMLDTKPTGKLSVSATVGGAYKASVSVSVKCKPTEATWDGWRNEVFARLYAAYSDMLSRWQSEQASLKEDSASSFSGGSPTRHREVVREELKRQVIEMLIGERFEGVSAIADDKDGGTWPRIDLDTAQDVGPYIQFLEQALEWSTMTYILYPYFWAPSKRWQELQQFESADAEYDKFLRSGSARVVVAARPGFECTVNHFMVFGEPWGGGPAPVPGDDLYVSVAQELKELTRAPADGIPGESWEARVPTSLVWLDPDPRLPKENEYSTLPGETK